MKSNSNQKTPSVNFHLWEPCNMRCKFCFATFQDVKSTILPKGHLPKEKSLELINSIANAGFKRISFCRGEPTLCPFLPDLIKYSKSIGLITNLITNGHRLIAKIYDLLYTIEESIDSITVSIESINNITNNSIGRSLVGKFPLTEKDYTDLLLEIKNKNILLRINTVVCKNNYEERLSDFISEIRPSRWKIIKAISILGQNDKSIDELSIGEYAFNHFLKNNIIEGIDIAVRSDVSKNKNYMMIDPAGRFFDDATGMHIYSKPILEVGVFNAIKEMNLLMEQKLVYY